MKTALDNYALGKQKEVDADDFSYVIRDNYRFFCPECLEPVTMVDGLYSKYFKHGRKTESTVACDLRVEGNEEKSIHERVGLPIFLRRKDNKFRLTLGFRPINDIVIKNCKNNKEYVVVTDGISSKKQKYYINYENFSSENTVYKDIEFIPKKNLHLEYSSMYSKNLLQPVWSDYVEMSIMKKGALFHAKELGGKIIRYGDCITTHTSYLWVIPHKISIKIPDYKGMDFNLIGRIDVDNTIFEIYEGQFNLDPTKEEFSKVAYYLRKKLGLFLLDAPSNITPIWPPCVRTESGYQIPNGKDLFYLVNTNNEEAIVYIYNNVNPTPLVYNPIMSNGDFFGILKSTSREKTININRRVISSGNCIKPMGIKQIKSASYLKEGMEIQYVEFNNICELKFEINAKVEAYLVDRRKHISKKSFLSGNVEFEKNGGVIAVFIVCNNKLISMCFKKNKIKKNENNINYSYLKKYCKEKNNSVEVFLNANLIKKMKKIMLKDRELYRVMKPYIRRQKAPIGLAKELRRF